MAPILKSHPGGHRSKRKTYANAIAPVKLRKPPRQSPNPAFDAEPGARNESSGPLGGASRTRQVPLQGEFHRIPLGFPTGNYAKFPVNRPVITIILTPALDL
jgi:hypothetical protein